MTIEDRARDLANDLWGSTALEVIHAALSAVRAEALEEVLRAVTAAHGNTGVATFGESAIRALIAQPAPDRPDPTRALAQLFTRNASKLPMVMLIDVGLMDEDGQWTDLAKAAYALANRS